MSKYNGMEQNLEKNYKRLAQNETASYIKVKE